MWFSLLVLSYSNDEIWISFHIGEGLACWQGCWSIEMPEAAGGGRGSCSEKVHLVLWLVCPSTYPFVVPFPNLSLFSSAFIDKVLSICVCLEWFLIFIWIFRFLRNDKYFKGLLGWVSYIQKYCLIFNLFVSLKVCLL